MFTFGGRTALVAVLVVFAGLAVVNGVRLMRGDRFQLGSVILVACGLIAVAMAIPVALGSGAFDNMISRFSDDNGSALARVATLHLLSYLDWKELLLGSTAVHSAALQSMVGLQYGIENFWISCIVQYGLIQTVLITVGLGCLLFEVIRRTAPGARVIVLFLVVIAAGSVSFSSKNIMLANYVALMLLLLPRRPAVRDSLYRAQARAERPRSAPAYAVRSG